MRCSDLWGSHIFGCTVFLSDGWQIDDCWAVIGLPVCIFSHVTTKALPGLDCRGCTCESAALCQCDNSRFFFFTGRRNKRDRKDEEIAFRWGRHKVIGVLFLPCLPCKQCVCTSKSDQLCSCRPLYWVISDTEHLCVAFVVRNVSPPSQK